MNGDRVFKTILAVCTSIVIAVVAGIFVSLLVGAFPSIRVFGLRFLTRAVWNPVKSDFGALSFIVGTLLTSLLALAISLPLSLGVAILLGEYYSRGRLSRLLRTMIDLLASVPSVIYGFWGLSVLVPIVRTFETAAGVTPYGVGIFTSSLILTIMIIPYSASIASEVIKLVPGGMKEAAYALGATRYEVVRDIILSYAKSGIVAGIMLALGRALGETMAVTLVIGNNYRMPKSIFDPGNTLASVIASEFTEAVNDLHQASMIQLGLVLFVITMLINIISRRVIQRLGAVRA